MVAPGQSWESIDPLRMPERKQVKHISQSTRVPSSLRKQMNSLNLDMFFFCLNTCLGCRSLFFCLAPLSFFVISPSLFFFVSPSLFFFVLLSLSLFCLALSLFFLSRSLSLFLSRSLSFFLSRPLSFFCLALSFFCLHSLHSLTCTHGRIHSCSGIIVSGCLDMQMLWMWKMFG